MVSRNLVPLMHLPATMAILKDIWSRGGKKLGEQHQSIRVLKLPSRLAEERSTLPSLLWFRPKRRESDTIGC